MMYSMNNSTVFAENKNAETDNNE
ncbi:hypothetical protein XNC3_970006 [Xenorhabdus nematophila F1]|nr:hypothetical protein XNC3_970006 [Xenorhabdus nematophila F1]